MKAYNLRILLTTGLFFFLFQPLLADKEVRYYDVELVVFETIEAATDSNEIWPTAKQLQIPDNAAILGTKFEGKLPPEYDPSLLFNTLSVEEYQLKDEVENITASEKYRLLLHTGWRQPGIPRKEAVSVYVKHAVFEDNGNTTTEVFDESGKTVIPAKQEPTDTTLVDLPTTSDSEIPKPSANMEGLITIGLSRYLHLDVEMLYKKEPKTETVDMFDSSYLEDRRGKESVFYMKQNRRMRSKETHFIDHPKFSMLVRITPYEVISAIPPPAETGTTTIKTN